MSREGLYEAPLEHRVHQETASFADGPIELRLSTDTLLIVDPSRDLSPEARDGLVTEIGCFIVDPHALDVPRDSGFKALRDGEVVTLGRRQPHRFQFSDTVSREHVRLFRDQDEIYITDLASTNGTFIVERPALSRQDETFGRTPSIEDWSTWGETAAYHVAGVSTASEYHPDSNEDAFFVDKEGRAVGVFDGMGGHAGSEEASALACDSVERSLRQLPAVLPRSLAELAIREVLEKAHETIIQDGHPGIGTTAIIAKVFETESGVPYAMIGSAGDSRAYLIRNDKIEYVTLDHVFTGLPEEQRRDIQDTLSGATDLSQLTEQERSMFINRNIIHSCLGGANRGTPTISITDFALQPGDRLLLTSDGIHDNLTNREIEATIEGGSIDTAVHDLVVAAIERSREVHTRAKRDDMTAVMLAYEAN